MNKPIEHDAANLDSPVRVPLDYEPAGVAQRTIGRVRRRAGALAWYSALAEAILVGCLLLLANTLPFLQGERTPAVWIFFYTFIALAAVGVACAALSLFGIRSWRTALRIVPGALLAILIGVAFVLACMYACALWGKRWS